MRQRNNKNEGKTIIVFIIIETWNWKSITINCTALLGVKNKFEIPLQQCTVSEHHVLEIIILCKDYHTFQIVPMPPCVDIAVYLSGIGVYALLQLDKISFSGETDLCCADLGPPERQTKRVAKLSEWKQCFSRRESEGRRGKQEEITSSL